MSGFPIFDLVVGMVFIFFLLSIICSSAVEIWFTILKTRARILEQWLIRIFDLPALAPDGTALGKTLGEAILDHCMVTALSKKGKSNSYIDAENFVTAFLDKISIAKTTSPPGTLVQSPPSDLQGYMSAIQNSEVISGEIKRTILGFANEAKQAADVLKGLPANVNITAGAESIKSELDHFREKLENWYDMNADRLTGTLKRTKAIPATFIIASFITVMLNVDSIAISKFLYNNKEASKQLADKAMSTYERYQERLDTINKTNASNSIDIKELDKNTVRLKQDIDSLNALDLPIGWKCQNPTNSTTKGKNGGKLNTSCKYIFSWQQFFGWLVTILAICMGAPFWFDILNKIANIRGAGPKPESSADKARK